MFEILFLLDVKTFSYANNRLILTDFNTMTILTCFYITTFAGKIKMDLNINLNKFQST